MSIVVDGQEIKQIIVSGSYISKVYYGNKIVFECKKLFESNVPVEETVYLTPGVYEVLAVGGCGGSSSSGAGGGGTYVHGTKNAIGGS